MGDTRSMALSKEHVLDSLLASLLTKVSGSDSVCVSSSLSHSRLRWAGPILKAVYVSFLVLHLLLCGRYCFIALIFGNESPRYFASFMIGSFLFSL